MVRGRLIFKVKWINSDAPSLEEPFNNIRTATEAIIRFFNRYPNAIGRGTWNYYLAHPKDPQFDSNDNVEDLLYEPD